ncbi:hypothetical protein TNCT_322801 [Trichonephila clavata]|uniref:Uncharacterized protein n=1 Tax=Trichonephila clavata TaxID=2740835 RepID=A0A8X6F690_TRICU|nr:hypothetical protein TNCT_322801 [Trichonephila clavata]
MLMKILYKLIRKHNCAIHSKNGPQALLKDSIRRAVDTQKYFSYGAPVILMSCNDSGYISVMSQSRIESSANFILDLIFLRGIMVR